MATIQELGTALKNAYAAGDIEATRKLATAIQEMRSRPRGEDLTAFFADQQARYGSMLPREEAGFFENVGTGFVSGFVGTGEMASLGAASLLEEEDELVAREKIKSVADALRPEGGDPDSISYLISSGLGSLVGALTPAAIAAAAPVSAPVAAGIGTIGAAAIGIGAGAGEASERARAAGATEEERASATLRGAAIGSLEVLPLGRILRVPGVSQLAQKVGGKTVEEGGSRIRSALTTGGFEAAQEAAAGFLQNLNERGYNAERELLDAGLIDEAIAGGGAGAILQAVVDTFTRGRARRTATDTGEEPTEIDEVTAEEVLPRLEEGQVQGELFARPTTQTVEPDTGEALTDFNADQINSAVDRLTARGVAPSAITEEAVFDEILAAEEQAATPEPEQLTIEGAIDEADTREIEAMFQQDMDDAEIAEIESMIRADEEAVAGIERMRAASQRETETAAARDEARAEAASPREAALEAVIGQPTTGSYVNLEKRFSQELSRRNIASGDRAKPTAAETARIRRAADAFAGMRPQEQRKQVQEEPLEVVETTPEATQLEELETRIPERRALDREMTQQSFPGMGRRRDTRAEQLPEEVPAPRTITKDFLDNLGVAPKAPIRKRTEGKDLNDPAVREQFVQFVNNPKIAQQTRLNVARELEGVPEAQLELFQPQPRGQKGGQDDQPRPAQPATGGAGVQGTTPTPDFGTPLPETGRPTEAAPTPRTRGMGDTERGTGEAPRRAEGEQLALNLSSAEINRLSQPLDVRLAERGEITKEIERVRAATESQQESKTRKVVPASPEAGAKVTKDLKKTKPKRTEATAPAATSKRRAPVEDNTSKQLNELFNAQDAETKGIATTLSKDYTDIIGEDITTADDRQKILTLLTDGTTVRDKEGQAALTYLGKVKRPIDGLYLAIFDAANQTPQYRRQPNETQAQRNFYGGMGQKPAQRALDWAKANLSDKTNKWIDETLNKEVREFSRIENTDYVEMFREREAKLAANEAALQSQVEAEMREDARANLNELSKMFSKMLERSAVVGLDVPLHPAVRVALRKGDLRGALVNLATWSPSSRVKQVASKLANTVNDRARLAEAQRATQGSKVKGIVYHGSYKTDIVEFKSGDLTKGLYFSPDRGLAESYMGGPSSDRGRVYEVMLDIKNPLIVKGSNNTSFMDKIAVALGRKTEKELRDEQRKVRTSSMVLSEKDIADLKRQGYDGIMNEDAREYVVFDASQVHMVDSLAGGTQVEVVKNLRAKDGKPVAGLFDPETNNIKLDADMGMNPHVILHEVTHAAVSATIANKNHPLTKQLTKLFEDVKPMLDSAYGATNVDEFASEAMANPEFQQKLAGMYPDGKEISAFQRFVNSVANFVRKLVGMQPKQIDSAMSQADRLIEAMLAPAPKYRDAVELPMMSAPRDVKQVAKDLGEIQKKLGPLTKKAREQFANGTTNMLHSGVKEPVKKVYLAILGSQALADVARKVGLGELGQSLHILMENQRGAMNTSDQYVQGKVREVERWSNKAGIEKNQALNNIIYSRNHGATIWQVDPTLTQAQARKKYGDTEVSGRKLFDVWKDQRADWNTLGPDGQRAYKTMRDMYKDQYSKLKDVIYGRIDTTIQDPEAAKKLKREVYARLFDTGTLDVYFPLIREGQYKLEYELKDTSVENERDAYVVEMFDNFAERERAVAELKKDDNVVSSSIKTHDGDYDIKQFQAVPPTSFVGQTLQTLQANGIKEDVQAEILRLFVDALPENSFAKSLQKRQGTPGYIQDAIYAMKTKGYDLGRQTARLEYSAKIQQLEDEILKVEPAETGGPKTAVGRAVGEIPAEMVKKELLERAKFARAGAAKKQIERVYKGLNQVAFIYTIGFNAASALVNLSQVPLFVLPMLGGKYGYDNTSREIFKAMRLVTGSKIGSDSAHLMGKVLDKASLAYGIDAYYEVTPNGDFKVRKDLKLDKDTVAELERMAPLVQMATKRNQLNRSFLLDAVGLEEGGRAQRGNVFTRNMDKISGISAMMFNQAERFNRQVTLITSYNLALEKIRKDNPNMSNQEARQKAAEEALYETQQTNGGSVLETAPRVAQQDIGRVAFMYKPYGLQMYYTMAKTAKEMVEAHIEGDKATRNRAFKQVMGFHGTALFFSGVYGLPLYGAVQLMMDALFFDEDEDDFNTIVRKQIGEGWFKGLLQEATGINIADRVRLTGLLIQENRYNSNASLEEDIMFYIGGPALSVGKRLLRAKDDLQNGEVTRGIENALPAGVANAYKTTFGRYQEQGGIYTRRGDPMYADMSSWEMLAQGIGFAPADYIFQQEQNQRDKRVERAILDERTNLMRRYYVALRMSDFDESSSVLDEIFEFNDKHPYASIANEDIQKSLKTHRRTSYEMYNGVTINPLVRYAIEESRREYNR